MHSATSTTWWLTCAPWCAGCMSITLRRCRTLGLTLVGAPVLFQVADEGRAEVAVCLLAGVGGHVRLERRQRLLGHAQRLAVAGRAHDARAGERRHGAVEGG